MSEEERGKAGRPTASLAAADGGVLGGVAFLDRTACPGAMEERASEGREGIPPPAAPGGGSERGGRIDRDFVRCEMAGDSIH